MSAYCRICNEKQETSNADTYVACNNCGSFACVKHHVWWGVSKNAFCTLCFPKEAAQAVSTASAALQAIVRNQNADGVEHLYGSLRSIVEELEGISLQDLIRLLNAIRLEITRRGGAPYD